MVNPYITREIRRVLMFAGMALLVAGCNTLQLKAPKSVCTRFDVGPGPEDFAVLSTNEANGNIDFIVSSVERSGAFNRRTDGSLRRVRFSTGDKEFTQCIRLDDGKACLDKSLDTAPPFHPVGISLLRDRLYVIDREFEPEKGTLTRRFSIAKEKITEEIFRQGGTELLESPNDLLAIGENEIYVSNVGSKENSVLRFDGGNFDRARTSSMSFANGLARLKVQQNDLLAVASYRGGEIQIYKRDPKLNRLKHEPANSAHCSIDLGGSYPDNLMPSPDGESLYVAAHGSLIQSFCHLYLWCSTAPTKAFEIQFKADPFRAMADGRCDTNSYSLKLLYENDGNEVSAGSTAYVWDDWLLMSQLVNPQMIACKFDESAGGSN